MQEPRELLPGARSGPLWAALYILFIHTAAREARLRVDQPAEISDVISMHNNLTALSWRLIGVWGLYAIGAWGNRSADRRLTPEHFVITYYFSALTGGGGKPACKMQEIEETAGHPLMGPGLGGDTMSRKTIAYVSDIVLGKTGDVISRKEQRAAIQQYAKDEDIEILAWFEDEVYSMHLGDRPGVRQLLTSELAFDHLLVERVGCLSGRWPELRRFLDQLLARGARMESATLHWDCVSQMARYYPRRLGERARQERLAARATTGQAIVCSQRPGPMSIARPETLSFVPLIASEQA